MIILDKPYVSDLLKTTIKENNIKVLAASAKAFGIENANEISNDDAVIAYNKIAYPKIYSNSENAINWISQNLTQSSLPENINLFKDKIKFRELIANMYPNFFYKSVSYSKLKDITVKDIPKPFIIKPAVGFFSMGVYKVSSNNEWENILDRIYKEMETVKNLYPLEVMDGTNFIVEQCIEGDEYAFDAYFDESGEPIIVGIFKHLFSSGSDVSDRVYYTSKEIIESYLAPFTKFLQEIGKLKVLKNFPLHSEVRITEQGEIIPIEINPMRYGGWCTTADLTNMAFNFNPYVYFFKQLKPNWNELLKGKEKLRYCIVILNNSTGFQANEIKEFSYKKLKAKFNKTIDLRVVDYNSYPLFGILFTESHEDNFTEIEEILVSDLKDFISLK